MRATLPPCAGPITTTCGLHREVERTWLSSRGWNVSSFCDGCGAQRYWYVITEDDRQLALDACGMVVVDRPAL